MAKRTALMCKNGTYARETIEITAVTYRKCDFARDRQVALEDTREKVDIIKRNAELKEIVQKEDTLRAEIDKIIAELQ